MLQLMYNIALRDQPVVPRSDVVYHTALILLKHPFYVKIPILLGGQHSEDHSVLTMWTIITQAEQNRYRSNWSKLLVQRTREDAGA